MAVSAILLLTGLGLNGGCALLAGGAAGAAAGYAAGSEAGEDEAREHVREHEADQ